MPKIDIKRGTSIQKVGPALQTAKASPIEADTSVGQALSSFGDAAMSVGTQVAEQERIRKDTEYVANTSVDADRIASEIAGRLRTSGEDPETHVDRYAAELDVAYKSLLENAPSRQSKNLLTSQLAGYKRNHLNNESAFRQSALLAKSSSKYNDSLQYLGHKLSEQPGTLDQVRAQHDQLIDAMKVGRTIEQVSAIEDNGLEYLASTMVEGMTRSDPKAARELLESGEMDDIFTAQQVDSYLDNVDTVENDQKKALLTQEASERELFIDGRQLEIFNNSINQIELDKDLESGIYGADEYIKLSKELARIKTADNKKATDVAEITLALKTGKNLNATDPKTKTGLDNYFEKIVEPRIAAGKISKDEAVLAYMDRFNYIPSQVKNELLGTLYNGSQSGVAESAILLDQAMARNPQLARQFSSSQDIPRISVIADSINAGMSVEEAVKAGDNMLVDANTSEYKAREKAYKDADITFDQSMLTSYFVDDPNKIPDGMKADFNRLVKTYSVDMRMDLAKAKAKAYRIIQSNWSITDINGAPEYMKFSPEVMYNERNLNPKWIKEQLKVEIEPLIGDEDVTLTPDPSTLNDPRGPAYLMFRNIDGVSVPLVDESDSKRRPLNWRPDISISESAKQEENSAEYKARAETIKENSRGNEFKDLFNELHGLGGDI